MTKYAFLFLIVLIAFVFAINVAIMTFNTIDACLGISVGAATNVSLIVVNCKEHFKRSIKNNIVRTGDYTGGDSNKTLETKHKSVKPEAHLSLANG